MTSARLLRIGAIALGVLLGACSGDNPDIVSETGNGGSTGEGGSTPTTTQPVSGGKTGAGGQQGLGGAAGGQTASGGQPVSGGNQGSGGMTRSGGVPGSGGQDNKGGGPGMGGAPGRDAGRDMPVFTGTNTATGTSTRTATGTGTNTATGTGTNTATGTPTGTATGTGTALDCSAPMPTSGGTTHCGSYRTGKAGSLSWELWSNSYSSNACITYYTVPAFSAKWNNNGDYLARLGIEWGGTSIAQLGEVTSEFAYKKNGSGGGYSYIGVYGWAKSPCVEYYIIEDSFNGMPFNPWNMQQKGSASIDGENYKFFAGQTNGTGGSRCGTPFQQYWSVRQKGRQCGVMTITKHFEEWAKVGMKMDSILEAKILVETGGGSGTVEFPIANVKATK